MVSTITKVEKEHIYFWSVYAHQWWHVTVFDETPTHHTIPYIGDVSILVTKEYNTIEKERHADLLIEQKEHELFNMTPAKFKHDILRNLIEYNHIPRKTLEEIDKTVWEYVLFNKVFIKGRQYELIFLPVKGVW